MTQAPHAVVTGASSGIGRAVAQRLLADGWRVTGLDSAPATLQAGAFAPVALDLADAAALAAWLAAQATQAVPQALVHAAGLLRTAPLGRLSPQDGELMWRVHVDAATRLADALLPRMCEAGAGRVVLLGSRVWEGVAGRSQYAATKAALHSLARSWAAEVAARGVTVNVVSPAATDTAMLAGPGRSNTPPRKPPLGRFIEPQEVAALVAFLLGAQAAAITGQDIAVCGGASVA